MIGAREPPPRTGSPRRLWCSFTRRDRRLGLVRGIGETELTRMLTSPASETPSMPIPEPAAQVAIALVGLPPATLGRNPCRDPDLVARRCTVDRLENEFEIEGKLELADDDDRRFRIAEPDEIARADLTLDDIAGGFEKSLDRQIERCLHANRSPFPM